MPDPARANIIHSAVAMMAAEAEGKPFEIRKRFVVLLPTIRGHKYTKESLRETPEFIESTCDICGQLAKATVAGTNVTGRAVDTDCPAADWLR